MRELISGTNNIAGLKIEEGTLHKAGLFRVMRDEEVVEDGLKAKSLKIVSKDVSSVAQSKECGL